MRCCYNSRILYDSHVRVTTAIITRLLHNILFLSQRDTCSIVAATNSLVLSNSSDTHS